MCIILFSYLQHPRYKLVLVANRDEFYGRSTHIAHFWQEHPHILAGKDGVGGGTWIGVSRQGRWSALTNYRAPFAQLNPNGLSRGHLTLDFLASDTAPMDYIARVQANDSLYNGYNLLLGTQKGLAYYSNVGKQARQLAAGYYGVSNHLLDTPWFKVEKALQGLRTLTSEEDFKPYDLLDMMQDTEKAPHDRLPNTGVPPDWEYALSSIFVDMPERQYGTCCTTVLLIDKHDKVHFLEKNYQPQYAGIVQEFHF